MSLHIIKEQYTFVLDSFVTYLAYMYMYMYNCSILSQIEGKYPMGVPDASNLAKDKRQGAMKNTCTHI